MGLIFDIRTAMLYESWCLSHGGKAMELFLERHLQDLIDPKKGERVLDIGCGSGNHLLLLNKFGLDINGVDASPCMISKARERLGNRCLLKKGMAEDLPFDDNEFDIVVLINTLEFLDDPLQALREAGRVAKRQVFIGVINSFSVYYNYVKLCSLYKKSIIDSIRPYNLWELKQLLRDAFGETPIRWKSSNYSPIQPKKSKNLVSDTGCSNQLPFGSFLGISATITYRYKTDSMPLKVRIKNAEQSLTDGI